MKKKAFIALLLCVAMLLPCFAYAENEKGFDVSTLPETLDAAFAKEKDLVERAYGEEDKLDTAVFVNGDGDRVVCMFAENIKYVKDDITRDKSTRLTLRSDGASMDDNDVNLFFPKQLSEGIVLSAEDLKVEITPVGAEGELKLDGKKATYPGANFTPTLSGCIGEIAGGEEIKLRLNANGATVEADGNSLLITSPSGSQIARLSLECDAEVQPDGTTNNIEMLNNSDGELCIIGG